MDAVVIHTHPLSPYGWTAALIAAEKAIPYTLAPAHTDRPEYAQLHPFRKMPVLRHGDLIVYETLAIAHYLDRAFAGPALQPADFLSQTEMLRWISVVNSYAFPVMNGLVKQRVARFFEKDAEALPDLTAPLAEQVALIEATLRRHPFLVGERMTLADAFLFPLLHTVSLIPEGAAALAGAPATTEWLERIRLRPSFAATDPMAPSQAAA
ncbi:MAG TPA: glutathione S-transferase family protein [Phenylobacterium sp.]|jgi:glutathione S-transferase|nr:glutathione S-transferase family protein [Phenylobacterium sp.]